MCWWKLRICLFSWKQRNCLWWCCRSLVTSVCERLTYLYSSWFVSILTEIREPELTLVNIGMVMIAFFSKVLLSEEGAFGKSNQLSSLPAPRLIPLTSSGTWSYHLYRTFNSLSKPRECCKVANHCSFRDSRKGGDVLRLLCVGMRWCSQTMRCVCRSRQLWYVTCSGCWSFELNRLASFGVIVYEIVFYVFGGKYSASIWSVARALILARKMSWTETYFKAMDYLLIEGK